MTVRDDINYSRWEVAAKELILRQQLYEEAQKLGEPGIPIAQKCANDLYKAQEAYGDIAYQQAD